MARILSCYGMHCPWEDSRGECSWHRGAPYPCELEEMTEDERERALCGMERDWEMEEDA